MKRIMKRSTTIFLQIIVILVGLGTLTLMLWEPHLEGRNAQATLFEVYFQDPFLAYAYAASIAFFLGLYNAFKLLGYKRQTNGSSERSVKAWRTIKYCAITLVVAVGAAEAYLFIVQRGKDDIAGGMAIGHFMILISTMAAIIANVFEKRLRRAADIKS
jgi:hypothetical protein